MGKKYREDIWGCTRPTYLGEGGLRRIEPRRRGIRVIRVNRVD